MNHQPIHDMNSTTQTSGQLNSTITTNSIAPTPTSLAGVSSPGSSPRAWATPAPHHVFKLGLDVDLHWVVTAIQCDHGPIKPAAKLTRVKLLAWVRQQVGAGAAAICSVGSHSIPRCHVRSSY
jgi:hypothetical protein